MDTRSKIEWTDRTWNPVRGCARVSPGCEHCYAERVAYRFGQKPGSPYEGLTALRKHGPRWLGRARFVPEMLGEPLCWRKPLRVFVNSMSDLFHADVTDAEIAAVFGVMAACPQHTFQVLTKRPERMLQWFETFSCGPHMELAGLADQFMNSSGGLARRLYEHFDDELGETALPWPLPNVWLGVSVEDQPRADERIPLLLRAPAAVRFVSAEPLLGPITFSPRALGPGARCGGAAHNDDRAADRVGATRGDDASLDWVIVGGESGPGARACDVEWISSIVAQCRAAGVSCFVKQLGARPRASWWNGMHRERDGSMRLTDCKGSDPSEWPEHLRVRAFPETPGDVRREPSAG